MGLDKAILPLGGKTMIQLQAEKLRAIGISEILVSGWADSPEGTTYVPDLFPHRGPLSGIHAGLAAIHNRSALVLPVDMPLIRKETLQCLIASHGAEPITLLEYNGEQEPLLGIYDAALAPLCQTVLQSPRHSPRRLLDLVSFRRAAFTGDPIELGNCNTPEDYQIIQSHYRSLTGRTL